MKERVYACIDLKSFYASVEARERNLNPLTTNLVVADKSRTKKTICLAVSPALKEYGIGGRARLFEVVKKVREINYERRKKAKYFTGKSFNSNELKSNPHLQLAYVIAKPRMSVYIKYSSEIYNIYLKYLSKEDIYVYSIDEIFCDITEYLNLYKMSPEELITQMIKDVYKKTGITATAGIGSNLYLAKVAMDIVAKHATANEFGVRIASLNEMEYRKLLWDHRPLTDFWRVGRGYAKKLENNNMKTMGDVARMSLENEDLLYKLFGVNAEFLIDHAWGYESCTMHDIKNYKPKMNGLSSGQVLHCAYNYEKTKIIVREMIDSLTLDIASKGMLTDQIILTIGYDIENLIDEEISKKYSGEIVTDYFGRTVPKHAHGSVTLDFHTSSNKIIAEATMNLFEKIINKNLLTRRINIYANNLIKKEEYDKKEKFRQIDLFTNIDEENKKVSKIKKDELEDFKIASAIIGIKNKYGKNAIVKAMDLEDGATAIDRNKQIGGHHE